MKNKIAENWPYPAGLEYTPPARGTWTIAHTPVHVPECYEIYVCPESCLRGVSLSAAEFGGLGTKFSLIVVEEEDWNRSRMEPLFIEGVTDLLRQRYERDGTYPPMCIVFNSCMHQFMDTNMNYIFRHLQERFPDVLFVEGNMNCTMRTTQTHYESSTNRALYKGLLPKGDVHRLPSSLSTGDTQPSVNVIGNYFALEDGSTARSGKGSELIELLRFAGYKVNDLVRTETYDEYQSMADAALNFYTHPFGEAACVDLKKRLGTPFLEVPYCWNFEEIERTERAFLEKAVTLVNGGDVAGPEGGYTPILRESLLTPYREEAEAALRETAEKLADWSVVLDGAATPRPFDLACLLETYGIHVEYVYADGFAKDSEKTAKEQWETLAKEHGHDAVTLPLIDFRMRLKPHGTVSKKDGKYLALGQKAAFYASTEHFINLIFQSGLLGYRGITELCAQMLYAADHPQNTEEVISEKAIGCTAKMAESLANPKPFSIDPSVATPPPVNRPKVADQASLYAVNTASDLSGVCSALYELGGLMVMHDASGCNSTYATHDEPRWYDSESLIFISGLREYDAILGNDEKYIRDVCEAAEETNPNFIAVYGSPIAAMSGTDFKGIARVIEKRSGIRTLHFDTSGMHTYQYGMRQAFRALAEQFVDEPVEDIQTRSAQRGSGSSAISFDELEVDCEAGHCYVDAKADAIIEAQKKQTSTASWKVNLLGLTPLDFSIIGNVEALLDWCETQHFDVLSSWAMNPKGREDLASLPAIARSGEADVNLVLSSTALDAAKVLYERFGIPYVVGLPMGADACARMADLVKEAALTGENKILWEAVESNAEVAGHRTLIIGEPVYAASLRWVLEQQGTSGTPRSAIQVLNPLEDPCGLLRETDITSWREPTIKAAIAEADVIYADPLYRNLLPNGDEKDFHDMPTESYSGRMYRDRMSLILGPDIQLP